MATQKKEYGGAKMYKQNQIFFFKGDKYLVLKNIEKGYILCENIKNKLLKKFRGGVK